MVHPHLRLVDDFLSGIFVSHPFRKERGKGWATHHSWSISDQFLPSIVGLGLWVDEDAK